MPVVFLCAFISSAASLWVMCLAGERHSKRSQAFSLFQIRSLFGLVLLGVVLASGSQVFADEKTHGSSIEEIQKLDSKALVAFTEKSTDKLGIVFVNAWWCGQCMFYKPKIIRFAKEHASRVELLIVDYGYSRPFLQERFKVDNRGYVLLLKNGKWLDPKHYPKMASLQQELDRLK